MSDEGVHRIGGRNVENLRLKAGEVSLNPPGISVLIGGQPFDAADQMRGAFPAAGKLHELTLTVATTSFAAIRSAGFDLIPDPTRRFPNHHRLIHPNGLAGFNTENLARLSAVLIDFETRP